MMQPPLTPEKILRAYSMGVFPMGSDDGQIRWYSPDPRCIFDFEHFHIPARLARTYRQKRFDLRVNTAWRQVLAACADRDTTWITDQIYSAYTQLHQYGFAHTVEAWRDGNLVGGLYGVSIGGAFMGESMFHTETDASKVCLIYLVERMKERGFVLLDSQFMTEHLATLGAINITRDEYMTRLQQALTLRCDFR